MKIASSEAGLWLISENNREREILKRYKGMTLKGDPDVIYWKERYGNVALLLREGQEDESMSDETSKE